MGDSTREQFENLVEVLESYVFLLSKELDEVREVADELYSTSNSSFREAKELLGKTIVEMKEAIPPKKYFVNLVGHCALNGGCPDCFPFSGKQTSEIDLLPPYHVGCTCIIVHRNF